MRQGNGRELSRDVLRKGTIYIHCGGIEKQSYQVGLVCTKLPVDVYEFEPENHCGFLFYATLQNYFITSSCH